LQRIEGIGPKIDAALQTAGINTFVELANATDASLRAAIEAAGMTFAPSLVTWAGQSRYLANGDEAGFAAYTERLTAGRPEEA
jgi:predicted flap endonuclease-1-like 5' DNA nuclease